MTINTQSIISGPYLSMGQTLFDYTFRADVATDLDVWTMSPSGLVTPRILISDYTVLRLGEDDGGQVQFNAPVPAGHTVYIRSGRISTQLTELESQGGFFPYVHEDVFDKLTWLVQQLEDELRRCIRFNVYDPRGVIEQIPYSRDERAGLIPYFKTNTQVDLAHPSQIWGGAGGEMLETYNRTTVMEDGVMNVALYHSVWNVLLLNSATEVVFPEYPAAGTVKSMLLMIEQSFIGGRTIEWPHGTRFENNEIPTIDPRPYTTTAVSVLIYADGAIFVTGLPPLDGRVATLESKVEELEEQISELPETVEGLSETIGNTQTQLVNFINRFDSRHHALTLIPPESDMTFSTLGNLPEGVYSVTLQMQWRIASETTDDWFSPRPRVEGLGIVDSAFIATHHCNGTSLISGSGVGMLYNGDNSDTGVTTVSCLVAVTGSGPIVFKINNRNVTSFIDVDVVSMTITEVS